MGILQINKNSLSLLIGIVLLGTVSNRISIIGNVPDISSVVLTSLLAIAAGVGVLFYKIKTFVSLTRIDVLVVIVASCYFVIHFLYPGWCIVESGALLLIYVIVRLTSPLNYSFLFFSVLTSVLILVFSGYLQYAGILSSNNPYFDVTGPYNSPAIYGGVLCLFLSALFTGCLHTGCRKRYSHFYRIVLATCIMSLPILLLIACRAAWIALLISIARPLYLTFFHRNSKFTIGLRSSWIFRLLILIFIFISAYGLYQLKPHSADGRILIWKVTLTMIKEKPLTGFGPKGFETHYMHYQASYLKTKGTPHEKFLASSNHLAYNEPLRLVVEYGIAGLLLYLCLLYVVIIVPRKKDIVTLSAQSILTAYLVWGLFAYPHQVFQMQTIVILALACLSGRCQKVLFAIPSTFRLSRIIKLMMVIALAGLAFIITEKYQYHRRFYNIMSSYSPDHWEKSLGELIALESAFEKEPIFWMYYCTLLDRHKSDSLLLQKIVKWEQLYPTPETYIIKGDMWNRMGQYKKAEDTYDLASWMVPSRQRARSKLALLYLKQGRQQEAKRIAHQILTEEVKVYGFETYEIHEELKRIFENQVQ
ncbi:O-antigen ligase family protein [Bacteroides congonensis]